MIRFGGELVSGNSDESDSVGHPTPEQKPDHPTAKVTMTLGKCLSLLIVFEILLGFMALVLATVLQADLSMAMIAWAVCAVGNVIAHVFSWYPKGVEYVTVRLAGSMISRTAPPLGFAVWGLKFCEPRIEASIGLILVLVYMAGLIADSYLNLQRSQTGVGL